MAAVLGRVDSRVPPELVFGQGLGDLLTVRSAGSVLDEAALAGITYGVHELGIPLVVALGHQSCGAVGAAVKAAEGRLRLPGRYELTGRRVHQILRPQPASTSWRRHTR